MKALRNESGQSTIEFIFTFAFSVCIIFVVFNSAINSVSGYLAHYATFMASRVYLTDDSHVNTVEGSLAQAEAHARETFEIYALGVWKVKSDGFRINKVNPGGGDPDEQMTVGAVTVFEQQIDIVGQITGQTKLELVSESFLGKEPTRAMCHERACWAITNNSNCDISMDVTLYDDGC